MDAEIQRALETDFTVDITTTGRTSGLPRRIEIWMLHRDGRFFITGTPGRRDWLANLIANRQLIVHVKQHVHHDVDALATLVTDVSTRRWVLDSDDASWYRDQCPLDELLETAPVVEVIFADR